MKPLFHLLSLLILALSVAQAAEAKRLLILDSQDGEPYESARIAMIAELAAQGFTEGDNLTITRHSAGNKAGLAKRHLMTEAPTGYDVIFVNGTMACKAAYEFGFGNNDYTFVFCSITDPVGVGLVTALNEPTTTNFTGVSYPVSVEARLENLMAILPQARKIGFVYADMPQSHSYVQWLEAARQKDAFSQLEFVYRQVPLVGGDKGHVRMAKMAETEIAAIKDEVDAFLTPCDQLGSKREFAEAVATVAPGKPLAALTENEVMQDWGAHFGVYPVQHISGSIAGTMIARIFTGEPITSVIPTNPIGATGVNLRRARADGIAIPPAVLEAAGDNVVE